MIQFEDDVVVVGGGYGADGYKLYRLSSNYDGDAWTTMPPLIVDKRRAHVAFLIPDEFTECD